jgi:hypothetical protein
MCQSFITLDIDLPPTEGNKMQRFFIEPNLGRYKELASGLLTPQERRTMLNFWRPNSPSSGVWD